MDHRRVFAGGSIWTGLAVSLAAVLAAGCEQPLAKEAVSPEALGKAGLPPVWAYVATELQSVRGGLGYDAAVQPQTCEVYVACETMWGGFYGAAHGPNNGTWRSADLGKTWKRVGPGGYCVEVSETNPNVIYSANRFGVYKTTDAGENWSTILTPDRVQPQALDIFPGDHNIVYFGSGQGRIHVSRDGGRTWRQRQLPAVDGSDPGDVRSIQVHPDDPDTIYVATFGGGAGGVWKSTDGGRSFRHVFKGRARALAVAPGNGQVVYTSTGVTHDGGETWFEPAEVPSAWMIAVHPADPNVAFYSRPGSPVWATIDGGKLFWPTQGVGRNYDGTEVEGLAVDAKHDILWAAGDRIWKGEKASTGRLRLALSDRGLHTMSLADIQSVPSGVWACSDSSGVTYSTDGKTWITTAMGMEGTDSIRRVAPSPTNPLVVYAGHETRLFKTIDGGKTWFNILPKWFPRCLIDPLDENTVYVSTQKGQGDMLISTDGGDTYKNLGKGRFLAIHPTSRTIYAERPDGLCASTDGAKTFKNLCPQRNLGTLFVSGSDPKRMFSARGADGLFASTDGGKTWTRVGDDRLKIKGPTRLTELADGSVWLADPAVGLVRSTDRGRTWQQVFEAMGAMAPDPWDRHSLYMISRGAIWWIHPKSVHRQEQLAPAATVEPAPATVRFDGPRFLDRSNMICELSRDVELEGHTRSLCMMRRGLKNVVIDGKGHTVRATGGSVVFGDDIESITVRNVHFAEGRGGGGPAIRLTNSRRVTIRNCTFAAPGAAVVTAGIFTGEVMIDRCRFANPPRRGAAIAGHGRHVIRRCTFEGEGTAIRLVLADGSVIEGNTIAGDVVLKASKDVRAAGNTLTGQMITEP